MKCYYSTKKRKGIES